MKIFKLTFFFILLGLFSSISSADLSKEELSEANKALLLTLPADQRANVEEKLQSQQNLSEELEEKFKEYRTIIERPEEAVLTKSEVDDLRDKIYGAAIFASSPTTFAPSTNIPIPSDYILGPGDELIFRYYGSETKRGQEFVSRSGEVEVPLIGPVNVVGLSLREAKKEILGIVDKSLLGAELSISLGAIKSIQVYVMGEAYKPGAYTVSSLATVTNALYLSGGVSDIGSVRNIQVKRKGSVVGTFDLYDLLVFGDTTGDLRLLPGDTVYIPVLQKTAMVDGAFRRPHRYEIKEGETVIDLIGFAGGLISEAQSIQKIEVNSIDKISKTRATLTYEGFNSLSGVLVEDGTQIFAHSASSLEPGEIELKGQVKFPGKYSFSPGERLSSVLQRAGGFADTAYPMGAVFTRESVKKAQKTSYERSADYLEQSIADSITDGSIQNLGADALRPISQIISRLRTQEPAGRLVVEFESSYKLSLEKDLTLQDGDFLFVPTRFNSVTVSGEVTNPTSITFRSGLDSYDYIKLSGGFRRTAEKARAFVIYPNGETYPLTSSRWQRSRVDILPGSIIIVPRTTRPFDMLALTKIITPIFADLASSAAALAVISDD